MRVMLHASRRQVKDVYVEENSTTWCLFVAHQVDGKDIRPKSRCWSPAEMLEANVE